MNKKFVLCPWPAIVLFILLGLSSCLPYCKKVPFTEEELEWMTPYTEGDTIYFVNDDSLYIDTLIVTKKEIFNPPNKFIFDLRGCNWMAGDNEYKAVAGYDFIIIHNQTRYKCIFTIQKECSCSPAIVAMGFLGQYTKRDPSVKDTVHSIPEFPDYTCNIVIKGSNLESGIHQEVLPVTEIYWNKNAGLIGYKISNDLYKISPN